MKLERIKLMDNTLQVTTEDERWRYDEGRTNPDGKLHEYCPSASWIADHAPKGKGFEKYLARTNEDEADAYMLERGEVGSIVHMLIAELVKAKIKGEKFEVGFNRIVQYEDKPPRPISVAEYETLVTFMKWDAEVQPRYLSSEESMLIEGDPWRPFGGTRDIRAEITIEEPVLNDDGSKKKEKNRIVRVPVTSNWTIDVKTSKAVYLNHRCQLNGYGLMPGSESDRLAILQVGYAQNDKKWKWNEIERKPSLFWSAYEFWKEENPDAKPFQRLLPLVVSLDKVDNNNILNEQLYDSLVAKGNGSINLVEGK